MERDSKCVEEYYSTANTSNKNIQGSWPTDAASKIGQLKHRINSCTCTWDKLQWCGHTTRRPGPLAHDVMVWCKRARKAKQNLAHIQCRVDGDLDYNMCESIAEDLQAWWTIEMPQRQTNTTGMAIQFSQSFQVNITLYKGNDYTVNCLRCHRPSTFTLVHPLNTTPQCYYSGYQRESHPMITAYLPRRIAQYTSISHNQIRRGKLSNGVQAGS